MGYINVIITACVFFPIIAFLITLPYIIYNYNKFGSILFIRTILIYLFVLYLLSAYFLIIMPLPSIEYVSHLTTKVQLEPFDLVRNIIRTVHFDYKSFATYINILKNAYVYQTIYNLFLTVPFGMFLRYYFKCNFSRVLLLTLSLSLFFELTQLTGLYYIYPHAYRLFDVDDLIVNTLGGIAGYLITPLFTKLLPSKDELDLKSYKKGSKVSSTKRVITFMIDMVITIILFVFLLIINHIFSFACDYYIYGIVSILIIFNIIPFITRGKTIGYSITNIVVVNNNGESVKRYRLLFRNLIFSFIYLPMHYYLYLLFKFVNSIANKNYSLLVVIGYISVIIITSIFVFVRNFILHKPFLYEMITKTKVASTIEIPLENSLSDIQK